MTKMLICLASLCFLATAVIACRPSDRPGFPAINWPARFERIRALKCQFTSRATVNLPPEKDAPRAGDNVLVALDDLDARKGMAVMISDSGRKTVEFARSAALMTFKQRLAEGNLISISVFPSDKTGRMPAVRSRHMLLAPGLEVVSRYRGYCDPSR